MKLRLWPTGRTLHIDIFVTKHHRVSDRYLGQLMKDYISPKEGDTLNIPKIGKLTEATYGPSTWPDAPVDPYEGVDHIIKIVVDTDPDGDPAAVIAEHDRRTGETSISGGKLENLDE